MAGADPKKPVPIVVNEPFQRMRKRCLVGTFR